MGITASIVSTAASAAGVIQGEMARRDQKKEAKDAQKSAVMKEKQEQQKAFGAQQAKAASGYGSTLGAGSSSLGG